MTSVRVLAVGLLLSLFACIDAFGCSASSFDPGDLVENDVVYSDGARFCAVVRWYSGIADFTSAPVAEEARFPGWDTPVPTALYATSPGQRKLIAVIPMDRQMAGTIRVASSGRYVVEIARPNCGAQPNAEKPVLAIYRNDGLRIATLRPIDIFTESDAAHLWFGDDVRSEIRSDGDDEMLVLTVRSVERRIDLRTGVLLDEKRAIFPTARVFVTPVGSDHVRLRFDPETRECSAPTVHVDSQELFAHAAVAPLPQFPAIAERAGVRGAIEVEVVVSPNGDVLCARSESSVFGMGPAAAAAVRQWKFSRFVVAGRPVGVFGDLLFHFEDVDDDTWREIVRNSPPTE